MPLSLTTDSRQSFESVSKGLRAIDQYCKGRDISDIEEAASLIDAAIRHDKDYALAVFYKGMVLDLIGTPADAVAYFQKVLDESDEPALKVRAKFNLGVAYYHQYSHEWLVCAKECLEWVVANADSEDLMLLSKAVLARTHAMWMRPSSGQNPKDGVVAKHIRTHFDECSLLVKALRDEKATNPRILATYENAWGAANMYITDHVAKDVSERRSHLSEARKSLVKAVDEMPKDWAITCNLGSLELRQGVLAKYCGNTKAEIEECYGKAERHLKRVKDELRPGYGFALYELGILYRVWEKWNLANECQNRVLKVLGRYRDVKVDRITREVDRISRKDASYP